MALYDLVQWVEQNGEVKAIDRLKMQILPDLLGEGVRLGAVEPGATCSAELLAKIRDKASEVVGQPCPA